MAPLVYNQAAVDMWDGTLDILTESAMKLILCNSSYVADRDNVFVEEGVNDAEEHELEGTNYAGGFGNAGRKALASKTITVDNTNDRADFDAADVVWSAIDAGTAAQVVCIVEITNDLASLLICMDDTNFPAVTNGGDLTLTIADLMRLSTV